MTTDIAKSEETLPPEPSSGESALSEREYEFLDRCNRIAMWLAADEPFKEVVDRAMEAFACTRPTAIQWIRKAQEFLSLGLLEDAEASKRIYAMRLSRIHDLCMSHAIADEVEITRKPTAIKVELVDGELEERVVESQTTRVKPRVLNTKALAIALKAAREAAHISGGRPYGKGASKVTNNTLVVGSLPPAQLTDRLASAALAEMLGAEVIDVESVSVPTGD